MLKKKGVIKMAAAKLKAAIEARGVKQRFIAEKIGISEQLLSQMLNGSVRIDIDTFFAIAVVLHLSPDEIYEFRKGA